MNTGSLRLRLILAASIAISLALGLAGLVFYYQFQKHASRLMLQDFNSHFEQLASAISFDDKGNLQVDTELSDPRFSKQFGGLYWQISLPQGLPLRSRSLWDETLVIPSPPAVGEDVHMHDIAGPNGTTLLVFEKAIQIEKPTGGTLIAGVTLGIDKTAISNAVNGFSNDMTAGLGLLYIVLMAASIAQILIGLRPLESIRKSLGSIRSGSSSRMDGVFPAEVRPLVNEMNGLLDARGQQLLRARKRAGNLAHGLKTPLTVLDAIAMQIQGLGKSSVAAEIRDVANDMRTLVERELMRARSSAENPFVNTHVLPVAERLVKVMRQTSSDKRVDWQIDVLKDVTLPIEAGDFMELLGNLLDNAQKHANHVIRVRVNPNQLVVEDDGPGVAPDMYQTIVKRGIKLDEHKVGSGLGLAIVQDLADAYGADLQLDKSELGGLAVQLTFRLREETSAP
jgi:signal transduction histidine kinase